MRAIQLSAFGFEHLELVELPEPEPGPGQVLVRLRHASLNFRDAVAINGGYGSQIKTPFVPCSDGAGEVVAVGSGVRRFHPGDRVLTSFFQSWSAGAPTPEKLASSLGGPLDGTLREYACFHEDGLCRVPDRLSLEDAATLPCAAVTAWNALAVLDRVGPADTVLVQGTGGVALFALQFAKLMGARVIATSSSDEKLERLLVLGADQTLNYKRTPEWGKAVRALSGGRGVDHVIEVGGAGTLSQSLRAARPGATISLIGVLSGARHELNLPLVFLPQLRLQGVIVGSRDTAEHMLTAVAAHNLKPIVDASRFSLANVREAFAHMQSGNHFGKITVSLES
jgi:NADPH:quinone reductase-like Zn-dependent oxidoreductase